MNRRAVVSGRPESDRNKDVHIELAPAEHEEPTWEVRHPREPRRRRLDRRTRTILTLAAVTAVMVNAGAAWTYWRITESGTGRATADTAVQFALRARSDLNKPLRPGATGNLTVTVINEYDFPIRVRTVSPGTGNVVADDEHRDAGCLETGVAMTRHGFNVSWDIPRNTIGAFTVPAALTMSNDANPRCTGAVFTVPVQVVGHSIQKQ